jgi:hypothetical protein
VHAGNLAGFLFALGGMTRYDLEMDDLEDFLIEHHKAIGALSILSVFIFCMAVIFLIAVGLFFWACSRMASGWPPDR